MKKDDYYYSSKNKWKCNNTVLHIFVNITSIILTVMISHTLQKLPQKTLIKHASFSTILIKCDHVTFSVSALHKSFRKKHITLPSVQRGMKRI